MIDQKQYKLLPFNFMRLNGSTLITNMGGDFLILSSDTFDRFVNYNICPTESIYLDLKAKHFIYDNSPNLPIQLLATQYRTKKSFLRNFTALHMVVVTVRCNQKCKYCQVSSEHADASKFDMTTETAKKCVDLIFRTPSQYIKIEFQGGEPLLNFDAVRYIVEYAEEQNHKYNKSLEFVICTNLTSVNDEQLAFCKIHNIYISTSLDGPAEIHNQNRLMENKCGSYQEVVKGLQKAQSLLGQDKISALMTTTRTSMGRFPEIVDEYLSLGFNTIFFRSLNPYGMANKHEKMLGYSTQEFVESYCEGLDYIIELNLKGTLFIEQYASLILRRMLTPFATGFVDLQSPTGAGIGGVIYDYNGNVFVADEGRMLARKGDMQFLMGHVDDGYKSLFGGDTIRQTVASSCVECLPQCCNCGFQIWCGADPVRNYTTQGDLIGYRPTNEFCQKNMALIKYILGKIHNASDEVLDVIWSWITGTHINLNNLSGTLENKCED